MSKTLDPEATRTPEAHGPLSSGLARALALGAVLAAVPLVAPRVASAQEHEHTSGTSPASEEDVPAPESDHLTLTDHPGRGQLVLTLGPIDLPARTTHHALDQMPVQTGRIPFDFTLSGYRIEVVDGDGNPVPQTVVHHFNVLDPERRELFLPIMRRVLAASHETGPQHVPGWLLGLPFREGDRFLALTMLHNPTERSYRDVSVRLVMDYERARRLPVYRVYPFHIDVLFPTGSKAFDLPPGRSRRSWEGSPAISGGIIGLGGHLHRYATRLVLDDVTEERTLYRVRPVTDAEGHIREVPVHRYSGGEGIGALIYPSHRYRVTVTYDNPTDETIPDGGMGSVAGGFIPLEEWPAADPDDPLFQRDYRWVLRSLEGGSEDHEHTGEPGPVGQRVPRAASSVRATSDDGIPGDAPSGATLSAPGGTLRP